MICKPSASRSGQSWMFLTSCEPEHDRRRIRRAVGRRRDSNWPGDGDC
jgi:hypothetical protein